MYLNEILPGNWREGEWPEHIEVSHTRWQDWERELVMEHDMPDREISRMTGRSVRAIQVMRHKMRKAGEVRTGV